MSLETAPRRFGGKRRLRRAFVPQIAAENIIERNSVCTRERKNDLITQAAPADAQTRLSYF